MARKPKLTWDQEQQIRLSDALRPAATGALTRDEAYKLIYESARSLRQGLSLHGNGIEQVLDELFGPRGATDEQG